MSEKTSLILWTVFNCSIFLWAIYLWFGTRRHIIKGQQILRDINTRIAILEEKEKDLPPAGASPEKPTANG